MAEHDARRHDAFERMAAATKALYAALSPEQKRTFDALPHLIGGHHHEGPGGDHGPHGGPEGPGERG